MSPKLWDGTGMLQPNKTLSCTPNYGINHQQILCVYCMYKYKYTYIYIYIYMRIVSEIQIYNIHESVYTYSIQISASVIFQRWLHNRSIGMSPGSRASHAFRTILRRVDESFCGPCSDPVRPLAAACANWAWRISLAQTTVPRRCGGMVAKKEGSIDGFHEKMGNRTW